MKRTTTNSIAFEIIEQDLVGNGAAQDAFERPIQEDLTAQGRCGWIYTWSFECNGGGIFSCKIF